MTVSFSTRIASGGGEVFGVNGTLDGFVDRQVFECAAILSRNRLLGATLISPFFRRVVRAGLRVFADRLVLFLLGELVLESLNLVYNRLPVGTGKFDNVEQLLDRQLRLHRQIPCLRQKALNLLQHLVNGGTTHTQLYASNAPDDCWRLRRYL